ncbi:acyltransferase family protein [Flavobacterium glaciei]|uniref:Peptidoglycan/LPS O-acetylase OafA/YrhL n=1 Tax=Flavobacterium glaciei TaxID=386300 RepID=A0A562Q811_9FLAO|nr:acyltransferase [Flavobacterium glaciei]RDI58371.1 peptidoglycan/LPS O-acetylase OafA/YrhL [Flavobacterium glaciei]TWI52156.1 peptidoglycan/LPS O-acetylase OafA/YrhL [Flavobacterium glaciei]
MNKVVHFRGLNGIRAFAAVAVLFSHTMGDLKHFGLHSIDTSLNLASYGVTMFFTLSGFLITFLLLKEKDKSEESSINVKNFYIRRILRIWPLYFLYLIICINLYYIFSIPYDSNYLIFYVFILANVPLILQQSLPFIGHLWSIAVEEQFYLFWPWIAKINKDKILKSSIILLLFLLLLKYLFFAVHIFYGYKIPLIAITVTRFYCMIIGCIAAILFYKKSKIINYLTSVYFAVFCWSIIFLSIVDKFQISSALIDHEIISIVTVGVILTQINRKNFIIDLDTKPFNFIGKISYGMYVYHPVIIFFFIKFLGAFKMDIWYNYIIVFFLITLTTILLSYVSYVFFENKFILMKDKYSSIKSSS